MPAYYALAESHNNTAGYIAMTALVSVHVSGAGTLEWGIEREYLDNSIEDTGTGRFEWEFPGGLLPEDIDALETNILNGARTGPVTASTKLNNGTWVDCNATLALPRTYTRNGVRYGVPVLTFTGAEIIP